MGVAGSPHVGLPLTGRSTGPSSKLSLHPHCPLTASFSFPSPIGSHMNRCLHMHIRLFEKASSFSFPQRPQVGSPPLLAVGAQKALSSWRNVGTAAPTNPRLSIRKSVQG